MAKKNPAAVQLGRKGGKARAQNLTPEQLKEQARAAVQERWKRYREQKAKGKPPK